MALTTPTFCTLADVQLKYGETAVKNWCDHNDDGVADTGVTDACINAARATVRGAGSYRYTEATMAASAECNAWTIVLAAWNMSTSRGNPPAEGLQVEKERVDKELRELWDCMRSIGITTTDRARPPWGS